MNQTRRLAIRRRAPGATVTPAVLTIGDPETITLSVSPDAIAEDAGATDVTVTATMSAARETSTTVNITLGGTAANPADYTATSLTSITIPKGQTTANGTLTITPVEDTAVEGDETITVSGESGARSVSSADITITDSTIANVPATGISVSGPSTAMERGVAIYTISLSPKGAVPLANLTVELCHVRRVGPLSGTGRGGGERLHRQIRNADIHPERCRAEDSDRADP